jgi:hypothetical protein
LPKTYTISQLFKTRWDELSEKDFTQVLILSEKLHHCVDKSTRDYGFLVIGMLRVLRKNKSVVAKIELDQAIDCFNDIKFFIRNSKGSFQTPWYFFPVPAFTVAKYYFEPPLMNGDLPLYNRTFDQLVFAESAFSAFCVLHYQFKQSPNTQLEKDMESAVNSLIAVLYQYTDFNVADIDEKAALIDKHLKPDQKALILHTYANVRDLIMKRCPTLFPKPLEDEEQPEGQEPEQVPVHTGEMWLNLRYDLAETEVFKGFDKARNALVYDALDYLEKKAKDALKQKENHAQE